MEVISKQQVAKLFPQRAETSHKGDNGWVLIVAGSKNMPGAAVLAARGALRAGAGKVTVAGLASVLSHVASNLPEAILLELPASASGEISVEAAQILRHYSANVDSGVIGPGIGVTQTTKVFLTELFLNWKLPTVLDADGLNCVAQGVKLPQSPCILTPHEAELARLLQTTPEEVRFDRKRAAGNAASRYSAAVLLKGSGSLVAVPGAMPIQNPTGNSGMAAPGMGDVLSGVIGTLLSQGLSPLDAASVGAFWHGLAGDLAAKEIGDIGFLAHEVADLLPKARRAIQHE